MRTYVYIDGFNFYYGAVKNNPSLKWLDFKKLFQTLLDPKHNILSIKYFTASVTGKRDPKQPARQKTYIRALKTYIAEINVIYGEFRTRKTFMPLANSINGHKKPKFVEVVKNEEKGSDVNLAVHLVNDAWLDCYDCAVVVSNDRDLAESLRIVKEERGKSIGLITPSPDRPVVKDLQRYATFTKRIRKNILATSQLPNSIPETTISKPNSWK